MADKIDEKEQAEMDKLAFELYGKRVASHRLDMAEATLLDCYRKAALFIKVRQRIRTEGISLAVPDEPEGADCRAPNLRPTHPYNLVAQVGGDLSKANRIKKFLDVNPTPAGDNGPEELLTKLNRTFPDLGWDMPTVNVARALLPVHCKA